jgi:hypothetical protein
MQAAPATVEEAAPAEMLFEVSALELPSAQALRERYNPAIELMPCNGCATSAYPCSECQSCGCT